MIELNMEELRILTSLIEARLRQILPEIHFKKTISYHEGLENEWKDMKREQEVLDRIQSRICFYLNDTEGNQYIDYDRYYGDDFTVL